MPVVMNMVWEGITRENYEACRKQANWEGRVPDGALFHVASFANNSLYVTDLWESEEAFQRFISSRLMPVVQQLGITSQPKTWMSNVYALFTPAFKPTRNITTEGPSSSMSTRMQ